MNQIIRVIHTYIDLSEMNVNELCSGIAKGRVFNLELYILLCI